MHDEAVSPNGTTAYDSNMLAGENGTERAKPKTNFVNKNAENLRKMQE